MSMGPKSNSSDHSGRDPGNGGDAFANKVELRAKHRSRTMRIFSMKKLSLIIRANTHANKDND